MFLCSYHGPTSNLMLHDVLSPSLNSLITSSNVFEFAGAGSHSLTRPSSFVTARKRTHGCSPETWPLLVGEGVKSVSVASRPEAGVPETVFKTWHVIGAAMFAIYSSRIEGLGIKRL